MNIKSIIRSWALAWCRILWLGFLIYPANTAAAAELPAFPGAEGFGATSVGGRGGQVIHVTNLNASGPGSLQAACEAQGPRIVVFDVSGVINGNVIIRNSKITIAGQTAPGAGITVNGMFQTIWRGNLEDITIRHLRVRATGPGGSSGDNFQLTFTDRLILDHVSTSWASDESIDLNSSSNVTVQWSTIEESDIYRSPGDSEPSYHNFGMILGYEGKNASIHHNLFAHHKRRTPLCGIEPLDHRNNVIYNLDTGVVFHPARMNQQRPNQPFQANIIGNYFKAGPDEPKFGMEGYVDPVISGRGAQLYDQGNYFSWLIAAGSASNYLALRDWERVTSQNKKHIGVFEPDGTLEQSLRRTPVTASPSDPTVLVPPVRTVTAEEAYVEVLERAGTFPRDAVTQRTISEVSTGTGSWGREDPSGGLMQGLTPGTAPPDTDRDGIPDQWERDHGLDPGDPTDNNNIVPEGASPGDRHKGFTYIEYYINELADGLIQVETMPPAAPTNLRAG